MKEVKIMTIKQHYTTQMNAAKKGFVTNEMKIVAKKENIEIEKDSSMKISCSAEPYKVYTLYIYSDLPVLTTVKADKYGNWQYDFKESIIDGKHEVYLALNDNTGKILEKSSALDIFIKDAKAVSVDDFIPAETIVIEDDSDSMLFVYLLITLLASFGGVIMFVAYIKYFKNTSTIKNET